MKSRYGRYTIENKTINLVPHTDMVTIRVCSQDITNTITKLRQKQGVGTILVDFSQFPIGHFSLAKRRITDAFFFLLTILSPEGRKKSENSVLDFDQQERTS